MRYTLTKAILTLGVGVALVASTTAPVLSIDLRGPWSAIAYDGAGRWGVSVSGLAATVEDDALEKCGGGNCKIVQKAKGRCAAWAVSKGNPSIWATSIGGEINDVDSQAENACSKQAPRTCVVVGHACS